MWIYLKLSIELHGVTIDIRHYDVTHKVCPEPYVRDEEAWQEFKKVVDPLLAKVMADDILAVDVILEELQKYQVEHEILLKDCISLTKTLEETKENGLLMVIDDIEVNFEGTYKDTINGRYDEFVIRRYIKN